MEQQIAANPAPAAPQPFAPTGESKDIAMDLIGSMLAGQPPAQPPAQPPVYTPSGNRFTAEGPQAVPPEQAPIPEVPAEQNIQLPQNVAENVGHAFAASRAEARNYRQMAEQFRSQLEAERAKAAGGSEKEAQLAHEINEWKQRYETLENRLGQMDLSQSREFREKYDAPLQGIRDEIVSVLKANGAQDADAAKAAEDIMVSESPEGLIAHLPAAAQGMIMYKLKDAASLWTQRSQALDEWRSTQKGLEEVSVRDNFVASAERRAKLADEAFERLAKIAPTLQWSDPEYDPRKQEAIAKAKAWYQQAPDDQVAAAAMEGFMAPFAYEVIQQLTQQVNELRSQLNGRTRLGAPPVAPYFKSAAVVAPPPPPPPKPGTPEQPWIANESSDPTARAAAMVGALMAM